MQIMPPIASKSSNMKGDDDRRHISTSRAVRDADGMGLDDVQVAYDEALRRVLRDLPPDLVKATITVDFTAPDDVTYRFTRPTGRGHGASLLLTDDPEEATAILADQVQEDVFEALWSARWPQCRWHDNPALARLVDGEAVWICARLGSTVAKIGEMSQVKRPQRRRQSR
jgi:hypothetical protein